MYVGYKLFDKTTHFDTSEELAKDNRAVGLVILGIFIGVGVAIGLVIGMGGEVIRTRFFKAGVSEYEPCVSRQLWPHDIV